MDDIIKKIPSHTPRDVALLPGLKAQQMNKAMLLPILILIVMLPVSYMPLSESKSTKILFSKTEQSEGEITEVKTCVCNEDRKQLNYLFKGPDGTTHTGKENACKGSEYYDVEVGDKVSVKYIFNDPTINGLHATFKQNISKVYLLIFTLFIVIAAVALLVTALIMQTLPNRRNFKNAQKIFVNGKIVSGSVVFVKKSLVPKSLKVPMREIIVNFKTLDGQNVESIMQCDNDWFVDQLTFGSPVTVAFLPDDPARCILLEGYIR